MTKPPSWAKKRLKEIEARLEARQGYQVAVYGTYKETRTMTFKQRFWHTRKDGVKQRYTHTIIRTQKVGKPKSGRYEFKGKGKDLYKAVKEAHETMPKEFQTVDAEKFLEKPERYGVEGEWIDMEIESP